MSLAKNFGMQNFISPSIDFDNLYGNSMKNNAVLEGLRYAGENPAIGYLADAKRNEYAMRAAQIAAQIPDKPHGANQFLSNASGLMSMASGVKGAIGGLGGGSSMYEPKWTPSSDFNWGEGGYMDAAGGSFYNPDINFDLGIKY